MRLGPEPIIPTSLGAAPAILSFAPSIFDR